MTRSGKGHLERFGYLTWVVGSAFFAIAAIRARDWFALAGSMLFLVGLAAFLIPFIRRN